MKSAYAQSGVDHDVLDAIKRKAQQAGARTNRNMERFGFNFVSWSRGESVTLIETPTNYLGFVVEGLGTKNRVADLYRTALSAGEQLGQSFYDNVAICNAAMAFNDCITAGALPFVYNQYIANGDAEWGLDEQRSNDLIDGTERACELAKCTWGGGETATLVDIIMPGAADLAGATIGVVRKKTMLIDPQKITAGDAIVLVLSSGVHANGLSACRKIAKALPDGYLTKIPGGMIYGEELLRPTYIYADLIESCQDAGVDVHYAVNITGHGWRKLMRAQKPFTYVIERVPEPQSVFQFIQEKGGISDRDAYADFNMGVGFALYVPKPEVSRVMRMADYSGFTVFEAGHIEAGEKKVVIGPKDITFGAETLGVR